MYLLSLDICIVYVAFMLGCSCGGHTVVLLELVSFVWRKPLRILGSRASKCFSIMINEPRVARRVRQLILREVLLRPSHKSHASRRRGSGGEEDGNGWHSVFFSSRIKGSRYICFQQTKKKKYTSEADIIGHTAGYRNHHTQPSHIPPRYTAIYDVKVYA